MKKAFTLLELMIAVAIFAGLIIMSIGALSRTTVSDTTKTTKESNAAGKNLSGTIGDSLNRIPPSSSHLATFSAPYNNYPLYPDNDRIYYYVYNDISIDSSTLYGNCRVGIGSTYLGYPYTSGSIYVADPCSNGYKGALTIIEDAGNNKANFKIFYLKTTSDPYSAILLYKEHTNCSVNTGTALTAYGNITTKHVDCGARIADTSGNIDITKLSDYYDGKYVINVQSSEYIWARSQDLSKINLDFYIKPNNDKYDNINCKDPNIDTDEYSGCRNVKVTYNVGPW